MKLLAQQMARHKSVVRQLVMRRNRGEKDSEEVIPASWLYWALYFSIAPDRPARRGGVWQPTEHGLLLEVLQDHAPHGRSEDKLC